MKYMIHHLSQHGAAGVIGGLRAGLESAFQFYAGRRRYQQVWSSVGLVTRTVLQGHDLRAIRIRRIRLYNSTILFRRGDLCVIQIV